MDTVRKGSNSPLIGERLTGKIDFHAHVRATKNVNEEVMPDADQLFLLYESIGVEKAVILPFSMVSAPFGVLDNAGAKKMVLQYPSRFYRFVLVDPAEREWSFSSLYSFLLKEKEEGALGVGEITSKVLLDGEEAELLFSCCEELQLPVLCHIASDWKENYGVVDEKGLFRLEKVLRKHPNLCYIGHAKPFWKEISEDTSSSLSKIENEGRLLALLRTYGNLYCDLSAQSGSRAMMRDSDYALRFMEEFSEFRSYLANEDGKRMREKMRASSARRSLFDKTSK